MQMGLRYLHSRRNGLGKSTTRNYGIGMEFGLIRHEADYSGIGSIAKEFNFVVMFGVYLKTLPGCEKLSVNLCAQERDKDWLPMSGDILIAWSLAVMMFCIFSEIHTRVTLM